MKLPGLLLLLSTFAGSFIGAQSPRFFHLSTSEGLSNNFVSSVARDQQGILWVGTPEGLNSFDGYQIQTYLTYQYPSLNDNDIRKLLVDKNNQVWVLNGSQHLTLLDKNRQFQSIPVGDNSSSAGINLLYQSHTDGVMAIRSRQHYKWNNDERRFERMENSLYDSLPVSIRLLNQIGKDTSIFYAENHIIVLDHLHQKKILDLRIPDIGGAAMIHTREILAYKGNGKTLYRINLSTQRITDSINNPRDKTGAALASDLRNISSLGDGRFLISTRFAGLYYLQLEPYLLENWQHDPLDDRSIGGNNTSIISYDTTGYVFVTTQTSGLHYFNIHQQQANSRPYFKDNKGEVFDGFIQSISSRGNTIWLGGQDRLIRWDRNKEIASFPKLKLADGRNITGQETIRVVYNKAAQLWIGTSRYGVLVCDSTANLLYQLSDSVKGLPSTWINAIATDSTGNTWIGTLRGLGRIKPGSRYPEHLKYDSVLRTLATIPITSIVTDTRKRVWIGSVQGAWIYDEEAATLIRLGKKEGLISNHILAIREDKQGNIYFGTTEGLSILSPDGQLHNYNRLNGLRNDRCEGILCDSEGIVWIGNLNCILRFNPAYRTFSVFEEGNGITHAGFRMRSCYQTESGELFWGTDKGLTWFHSKQLRSNLPAGQASITSLAAGDSIFRFTNTAVMYFFHATPSFRFLFSSGDLSAIRRQQIRYQLEGFDTEWQSPGIAGQAQYGRLLPGTYTFHLQSSLNGIDWRDASNLITIVVDNPWWKQVWFKVLAMLLVAITVILVWQYLRQQQRKKEIQEVVDFFANSRYEKAAVSDVVWDICRNCMARLGFVDCVVYLLDEERQLLTQEAAYGPKSPKAFSISNPLQIPVGKGIVGHVAASHKPIIVHDTRKDDRYLVDDSFRRSEIAVPIMHEGNLIGVIDSEHPRRKYFKSWHLSALQAIAAVSGPKISKAMATEAMLQSEKEIMQLNVKMAESRFLNLRLQMNPHFLFNSLSSIQHLIVSQQTNRAYKYLTIFSHFLRTLLKYADKNFVPLDEELKILRMYIELESLRFDDSFQFYISLDESLENETILIPTLMVQPFAENAIWHGLLHKVGEKKLSIHFSNGNEDSLQCTITDNGIGREKAASIREASLSAKVHESKGISIIRERLALLQQKTGQPATVNLADLPEGGTRVTIQIPYYNQEEL